MQDSERYDEGLKIRRAVLGDSHVDKLTASMTEFNKPFQDFITRYAWGEVWARPGLDRRTRSLITLAMLISLNREEEFKMHVRAALRNGVSADEMGELILHAGIYCGLPAANNAFAWADTVLKSHEPADESAATAQEKP